jgi:hypothetical protein
VIKDVGIVRTGNKTVVVNASGCCCCCCCGVKNRKIGRGCEKVKCTEICHIKNSISWGPPLSIFESAFTLTL